MQKLFLQSRTIDLVTLIDTLVASGVYNKDESVAYMKVIAEIVPSASNIADYAKIVRDKSLLRRLINACDEINTLAYDQQDTAQSIVDMAGGKILGLSEETAKGDFTHIRDVLIDTYAQLDEIIKNKVKAISLSVEQDWYANHQPTFTPEIYEQIAYMEKRAKELGLDMEIYCEALAVLRENK